MPRGKTLAVRMPMQVGKDVIAELRTQGMSYKTIAKKLGPPWTIDRVLRRCHAAGLVRRREDMDGYSRACQAALTRCASRIRELQRVVARYA